jgi:hypothetical protein
MAGSCADTVVLERPARLDFTRVLDILCVEGPEELRIMRRLPVRLAMRTNILIGHSLN